MLAGLEEPDGGLIVKPSGLTIGYLPQDGLNHTGRTLRRGGRAGVQAAARHARGDRRRSKIASATTRCRRVGARGDADPLQRPAGGVPARLEGYSIDLQDHDRAARPRLHAGRLRTSPARRSRAAGRCASRSPSCCSAARACCCSTSRPTTSISKRATGWRSTSSGYPARGHPRLARSLLPRRGGDAHHRDRPAHADRLHRQLQRLPARARGADGAAAAAEARSGRRGRADGGVHQPLPLPGDQGGAGAEPDQDAGEDRADRDSARAQARALHVPGLREERPHGAGSARRREGVRRAARCSAASTCTSSAAIASRSSARTAPASRR